MKKMAAILLTAVLALGSSMSVMAADFTPSVTQKEAPEVDNREDSRRHRGSRHFQGQGW